MTTYKEFKKICSCRVYLKIYSRVLNTTFLNSIPGKQVLARMCDCGKKMKFARRKKVNICNRYFLLSGEKKSEGGKNFQKRIKFPAILFGSLELSPT